MIIGIIGLGLIGGSLGIDLKKSATPTIVIGHDLNTINAKEALKRGLIDEEVSLDELILRADIIFVCTPVAVSLELLPTLLDNCKPNQVIADMGSTKKMLCDVVLHHPNRSQFVAAHPIAGTENSGPEAAISSLFQGKKMVVCDQHQSSTLALKLVSNIFRSLGMDVLFMDSAEHDKHVAYISHLSHITSFALGLTVLKVEQDERNIFNLAGSGFSSTVRLAKSSPEMWSSIFTQNKENILPVIEAYIHELSQFKELIVSNDQKLLTERMLQANEIRRIIK